MTVAKDCLNGGALVAHENPYGAVDGPDGPEGPSTVVITGLGDHPWQEKLL